MASLERRWEVFHSHPVASPPPLAANGGGAINMDDQGSGWEETGQQEQQHWRSFDSSVNAVSFGFVATAILISMFLVMAIFERFIRPDSPPPPPPYHSGARRGGDVEASGQLGFHPKLGFPSPEMTVYSKGVSVLMPGEEVPTFIARPAPALALVPCPPEQAHDDLHAPQTDV